jgi:signal transduction histidine kinase
MSEDPTEHAEFSARDGVPLDAFLRMVEADSGYRQRIVEFSKGDVLMRENENSRKLWLILEGDLQLTKSTESGEILRLDQLGPGELVGILSFYARDRGFFGVEATSNGKLFYQSWEEFNQLQSGHPRVFAFLQERIRQSFMQRYRRLVSLHLKLERANQNLNQERQDLQRTIEELELTRGRLVQQEKLALMGSIVPGIAHELNNPAASLSRNADYLEGILQEIFTGTGKDTTLRQYWEEGLRATPPDTRELRERMKMLAEKFPQISRTLQRRLAALPLDLIPQQDHSKGDPAWWEQRLRPFEAGRFLYVVRSAATRITRLVQSLRRYSRPASDEMRPLDLALGVQDTLLILGSLLRDVELQTNFGSVPKINGIEHELNQVWTNLIVNAVEAMDHRGSLSIECKTNAHGEAELTFADSGPGVSAEAIESIFEPNYTTKAKGGNFGLGLGLSISKAIVQKHGGQITVEKNHPQGAKFSVRLPVSGV